MGKKLTLLFYLLIGASTIFSQAPFFSDISDEAGTGTGQNNRGIILGDYNSDGHEDIFVIASQGASKLYKNLGDGTFENVTDVAGIHPIGLTRTGAWGDIDNDGDLDLLVATYYTSQQPISNYCYQNNGDGTFTDISESSGLNSNDKTRSVHMVDIDLDGYLDIYVCNLSEQNVYWRNNGNNTFTNNTAVSGLYDTGISMGAVFFDYDNDGDQDLYLTHDADQPNIMYANDGFGHFANVSVATNSNVAGNGMGVDHGDINNDGHFDLYVTNLGANFLLLNDGNGSYTEIAAAAGVSDSGGMGWGCFFLDYDNDGWEDIYVINDFNFSPVSNKLYKNNSNNTFTLVSENSPLNSLYGGIGGHWADLNNDGFPEIIIANRQQEIGVQIFENNNTGNNWIGFELEGTTDSKDACGTRLQVNTSNGTKIDEVTCGSSYASMSSKRIYFGLGTGDVSDIHITWPNGSVDFMENLQINQIHFIQQGSSGADLDGDGFILLQDCDDNNSNVNPDAFEISYNGIDDDCNPMTLDDDLDQDGFNLAVDCDDTNAAINSSATEIENNGIDEDCDGSDLTVSLNEVSLFETKIFPIPATDKIFLETNIPGEFVCSIFNTQGVEMIQPIKNASSATKIEIPIADLSTGIYFIQIDSEQRLEYFRIVKQ